MAIKFNDLALSLGKQTTDISLIMTLLLFTASIAYSMQDPCRILEAVKEVRELALLTWSIWLEIDCLYYEANAHLFLGNLPRARTLTERLHEQVNAMSMENSDCLLAIFDLQKNTHLAKTEYLEAKQICESALTATAITHSPRFYAHFLVENAYIGILIGSTPGEILNNSEAAEAVYKAFADQRILLYSWIRAELELSRGNLGIASFAFKECLTRSLVSMQIYQFRVLQPLEIHVTRWTQHGTHFDGS
jgi:hypothetical protein